VRCKEEFEEPKDDTNIIKKRRKESKWLMYDIHKIPKFCVEATEVIFKFKRKIV